MTVMSTNQWNVGLVGYGEVGRILAEDLRKQDVKVAAYDIKLHSDSGGGPLRDHASSHGVAPFGTYDRSGSAHCFRERRALS